MKKTIILSIIAAGIAILGANADVLLQHLKVTDSQKVLTPMLNADSLDNRGNKFTVSKLLKAKRSTDISKLPFEIVETDSTGLTLRSPESDAYICFVETDLRAERFAKGKIKVNANVPFNLYVDGKDLGESTDSSPITLEPEKTYRVLVKTVTTPADTANLRLSFVPDKEYENVEIYNGPNQRRHFELADTQLGLRVTNASLSPDGKYMLVSYRDSYTHDKTNSWSVLKETATGKVINGNITEGVKWMPKQNKLYYTRRAANGTYDIYTISVPDMSREKIADEIPNSDFTWSPTADYIIYYDVDEGDEPGAPLRRYRDPDDRQPGYRTCYSIIKYDIKSGISQPLVYNKITTQMLDISLDGKKILLQSLEPRFEEFPFYFTTVTQMDVNTLAVDTIIKNEGAFDAAIYSPDAKKIFACGGPSFQGGVGLQLPEGMYPNDFDAQGFIVDVATKKVEPVTMDFNPSIVTGRPLIWNASNDNIYFIGENGFNWELYTLDTKTRKISRIPTELTTLTWYSMGEYDNQWIAYCGGGDTRAGAAYLYNLKTGKTRLIDDPLQKRLADVDMGNSEPWWFTASDGTRIEGRCVLPPNFDPRKKYPLIVYYYGGTSPSTSGITSPYSPQVFASRDYVVYVINPSGTTGYGQEFSARHVNAWGKRTSDDIIEGTKEFCKQHPFVDDKKIGCIGASYGGFMTQYLLTKTDIFAAAVSHAGISNVTSYWGEGYWGYSYNTRAAAQSYPWNNPKLFTEQGSLFNADKIHTPLLLLHGTVDTNVPIGESIQLFNALKILNREVEFITVDGENHIITDYPKKVLWQNTIMAWFAKWLQDDPRWWDSLYGK